VSRKPKRPFEDLADKAVSRREAGPRDILAAARRALGSTQAVADALGTSPRNVQRWLATTGQQRTPRGANLAAVQQLGQRADVRRAMISPRRAAQMRRKGAKLKVKGEIGPVLALDYRRERKVDWRLSGDAMDAVLDAWERGDLDAVRDAIEAGLDEEYVAGFMLNDVLEELRFTVWHED
jgi:hypothetical protein